MDYTINGLRLEEFGFAKNCASDVSVYIEILNEGTHPFTPLYKPVGGIQITGGLTTGGYKMESCPRILGHCN